MNKARILSPNEIDSFRNTYLSKVFTEKEFRDKVFNENDWHFYPMLWIMGDEHFMRNTFSMAHELGEKSIYLSQYLPDEKLGIIGAELPFEISNQGIRELFDEIPYCIFNSVLLGTTNEWGIYLNREEDYAILGCSRKVRDIVEKYYALFQGKFEGGEGLIDYFFEGIWADSVNSYHCLLGIYFAAEKIKRNYPSMFSDIPFQVLENE